MAHFNIVSSKRQPLLPRLPLKKPISFFIETTNICNFRCNVCVQGSENTRQDLAPFHPMEFSLFKKIIQELRAWPGPKLKLLRLAFHGEPFTQKNFCDFASLAVSSEVSECVDTFSNASLMDKKQADAILDSGIHRIRFSIYSVIQDRHKSITKNSIDIFNIKNNIEYLRNERDRRGLKHPFIFVKAFDNYSEENDLFFSLYKDIADKIDLEKVHNATSYKNNNLMHNYYGNTSVEEKNQAQFHSFLHDFVACPRPFMNMIVTTHGDCVLCTLDAPRLTKIGNVYQQSLQDLWHNQAAYDFRKMQLEGRKAENRLCRNCDWFRLFPPEDCVDGFPVERLNEF